MEYKYASGLIVVLCLLLNIFGWYFCLKFFLLSLIFLFGFLTIIYLQHDDLNSYLGENQLQNPLEEQKSLGLNLVNCDKKRYLLISPNVKIQTESKTKLKIPSTSSSSSSAASTAPDPRKKSLIDSGIELLFKKHLKNIKDGHLKLSSGTIVTSGVAQQPINATTTTAHSLGAGNILSDLKYPQEYLIDTKHSVNNSQYLSHNQQNEEKRWKPFETIKIYTERKKGHDVDVKGDVHFAEECINNSIISSRSSGSSINNNNTNNINHLNYIPNYKLHTDSALLDEHGSPKHKNKTILSGYKQIDHLLHTIINYVLRDYIDSWFCSLSDNKEFSEFRARNCIEESVQNICLRIKNIQWLPLITTKLIDNIATHSKLYRLANQSVTSELNKNNESKQKLSPQRHCNNNNNNSNNSNGNNMKKSQHRRNKSDTDLNWYLGQNSIHKNVANSKFYTNQIDEQTLLDPEMKLLNAFFNNCNLYKNECLDERALENYLTHIMETILYFSLPEEDFACLPLRTFLGTLLANVVLKPLLEMLSDPDFINLQVARLFSKEPPPAEFFIKLIRQCTDLSELRACRQLLTKEMDIKFSEINQSLPAASSLASSSSSSSSSINAELTSLKYTQNIIDLRISHLQNNKSEINKYEKDKPMSNLPILTLDELLTKELALSYYLDYLSILNLQKYVIFYLTAQEWKSSTTRCLMELQTNKIKTTRDEILKTLREKAYCIYNEYLITQSLNYLNIDHGLIEALNIKLKDSSITPDCTWFESICKFVYEKIKNEDVFLNNFYHSSSYKKLLLELEFYGQNNETIEMDSTNLLNLNINFDTGSDSNSGDILFDDDSSTHQPDFISEFDGNCISSTKQKSVNNNNSNNNNDLIGQTYDLSILPILNTKHTINSGDTSLTTKNNLLLDIGNFKHSRSHSDCTGLMSDSADVAKRDVLHKTSELTGQIQSTPSIATTITTTTTIITPNTNEIIINTHNNNNNSNNNNKMDNEKLKSHLSSINQNINNTQQINKNVENDCAGIDTNPSIIHISNNTNYRLSAKIINTAIHCEGQYAVYAIQVHVIEDNQQKSWHIYRRYSKFLELKKYLVKKYPTLSKIPFPGKKAFQNTQRAVLEHRMIVLNEFLMSICHQAEHIEDIQLIMRAFLEPDNNDKKIHGGAVIRTIETLVHPFKYGMKTIKNMPDTLVGGIAKILLGRTTSLKDTSFLDVTPIHLEQSSEYPALTSALNLLDEIFDLQARSQWLRRGIINRLLGAPWVSHAANKRIVHATKSIIEIDKIEQLLSIILNNIWPDGKHPQKSITREDNTKLRTRMAAKMSLFALLSDDLKHVVGSETTRYGLLNCFSMWQHKKLNLRLALVLLNDLLTTLYQIDDMAKHNNK